MGVNVQQILIDISGAIDLYYRLLFVYGHVSADLDSDGYPPQELLGMFLLFTKMGHYDGV